MKITSEKLNQRFNINTLISFGGLIIVFLLFALTTSGRFIQFRNLQIIITQTVLIIIAGAGTTFVMSHGNIDFSLGGEVVLICAIAYYGFKENPYLLIPLSLFAGVFLSSIMGTMHVLFKLPTFVLGLCMMFMGRGIIKVVLARETMIKTPSLYKKFDSPILYIGVIVGVIIISYFLFEKTKLGKFNKAIGSNANAAFLSGIPVNAYKMFAFIISGITLGIASIVYMIKTGGVTRTTGNMLEIDVLISLVLGGMPLNGGSTVKMRMIVIGALILTMLSNGMIIWGLGPVTINVIKAIIFLGTVCLSYDRSTGYIA